MLTVPCMPTTAVIRPTLDVIPAKAGTHESHAPAVDVAVDSRQRRNDIVGGEIARSGTNICPRRRLRILASPSLFLGLIHAPSDLCYSPLSTIARTVVDANDAMDKRVGELRGFPGPCGGALVTPARSRT